MKLLGAFAVLALQAQAFYFFPHADIHGAQKTLRLPGQPNVPQKATFYPPPHEQNFVKPLLANVSTERIYDYLKGLTDFHTRYHESKDGRKSQQWLLFQIQEIVDTYNSNGPLVTVTEFKHNFPQRSIIARIHGSNVSQDDSLVILGAHLDSKNYEHPDQRAPGADDDGSGTVTLLEAFRVLAGTGYAPARTVELHWYAAEEGGLFGSHDVVKAYKTAGKRVAGMTQYDMTAWVKNGTDEVMGILSSDVDLGLLGLHVQLVNEYIDLPSAVFRLPLFAGSDHMPWHWEGYPASAFTEGLIQNANLDNIHTKNDRMDISPEFSIEHMRRFVQHAIAFVVEVARGT